MSKNNELPDVPSDFDWVNLFEVEKVTKGRQREALETVEPAGVAAKVFLEISAIVLRILKVGFGIARIEASEEQFAFTFDKIQHYEGQTAKELGLRVGSRVRLRTRDEEVVESVELILSQINEQATES